MTVYVYCLTENYSYQTAIQNPGFENDWFKLEPNGLVTVKATPQRGYSWDGCSPKWKLNDIYCGTPEGIINKQTAHSKTYYASLIHDVFYQFSSDLKDIVKRKDIDVTFKRILKRDGFRLSGIYYIFVHAFGWIWWGKPHIIKRIFGRP